MEPPSKQVRKPRKPVSFSKIHLLSYAITHFPSQTSNRWHLISKYVSRMDNRTVKVLYDISESGMRFDLSHTDCQLVLSTLRSNMPGVGYVFNPFVCRSDSKGFMPIVLLSPASQCCGSNLLICNRPSHARVYTTKGTENGSLENTEIAIAKSDITTATWRCIRIFQAKLQSIAIIP